MNKLSLFCAGLVLCLVTGCAQLSGSSFGTTKITLSGSNGARFTGYYVKDGERTSVSGEVPWTYEGTGLSHIEIMKVNPDDTVVMEIHYENAHFSGGNSVTLDPKCLGAHATVGSGFTLTPIAR